MEVEKIMQELEQKHPGELEYLQAVREVLLSIKDILGTMMVAALVVAVVSAFIPFHKAIRVKVVRTGEDMV